MAPNSTMSYRRQLPTVFFQSLRETKGRQGVAPTINPRYSAGGTITRAPKSSRLPPPKPGSKVSKPTPGPPQVDEAILQVSASPKQAQQQQQQQQQQQPIPAVPAVPAVLAAPVLPINKVHLRLGEGVYAKISRKSKANKLIQAFCKLGQHRDEYGLVLILRGKRIDRNTTFLQLGVRDNDRVDIGWPANPERTKAALARAARLIHEIIKKGQDVQAEKA